MALALLYQRHLNASNAHQDIEKFCMNNKCAPFDEAFDCGMFFPQQKTNKTETLSFIQRIKNFFTKKQPTDYETVPESTLNTSAVDLSLTLWSEPPSTFDGITHCTLRGSFDSYISKYKTDVELIWSWIITHPNIHKLNLDEDRKMGLKKALKLVFDKFSDVTPESSTEWQRSKICIYVGIVDDKPVYYLWIQKY